MIISISWIFTKKFDHNKVQQNSVLKSNLKQHSLNDQVVGFHKKFGEQNLGWYVLFFGGNSIYYQSIPRPLDRDKNHILYNYAPLTHITVKSGKIATTQYVGAK